MESFLSSSEIYLSEEHLGNQAKVTLFCVCLFRDRGKFSEPDFSRRKSHSFRSTILFYFLLALACETCIYIYIYTSCFANSSQKCRASWFIYIYSRKGFTANGIAVADVFLVPSKMKQTLSVSLSLSFSILSFRKSVVYSVE